MRFSISRKKPSSASSATAVVEPKQPAQEAPPAQRDAGDVLVKLRQSFGEVVRELGRIEIELKKSTEELRVARGAAEGERAKLRRTRGPDAAPTQRLMEANARIPQPEGRIANLRREQDSLKKVLPPEIVTTREALAEADKPDRREFSDHLGQALQVLKRIEDRAVKFEGLTTHYSALVKNYKFVSLDQYFYASSDRPPYTGSPVWRTAFIKWRKKNPELEKAPGRQWLDGIRSLVEMAEKLQR